MTKSRLMLPYAGYVCFAASFPRQEPQGLGNTVQNNTCTLRVYFEIISDMRGHIFPIRVISSHGEKFLHVANKVGEHLDGQCYVSQRPKTNNRNLI